MERSAEALLSSEPALAQLHAKRATATAPEVEKARALSLQRAELKNAEVALQALCTQRQQGEGGIASVFCRLVYCSAVTWDVLLMPLPVRWGHIFTCKPFFMANLSCLQSPQDTSKSGQLRVFATGSTGLAGNTV